jgi:putative ABC transport system permease protein
MAALSTLDRKLWRNAWGMRLQALAIALVIAGGMSIFVMALTTLNSLYNTRLSYYTQNNFGDIFATLKRAPEPAAEQLRALPGVRQVQTGVIAFCRIYPPAFDDPVSAHILSLPSEGSARVNRIVLTAGRLPAPDAGDEVVVSREFARAHNLGAGASFDAIINGHMQRLRIVGLASSPEYIYQIAPGAMFPDYERYAILWMAREPLANAYAMDGAFNKVSLSIDARQNPQDIITRLDDILSPYGGTGAIARVDQLSHRMLSEELRGLKITATIFPLIFLGVSAFLTYVVIARIVALERRQIAILKAFGYARATITIHYVKLILLIATPGALMGILAGMRMGEGMSRVYMNFYSLPFLHYSASTSTIGAGLAIIATVCISATLVAVRRAVDMPPAEGMLPPAPPGYRPFLSAHPWLNKIMTRPQRMILRNIERRPTRSVLTSVGIGLACSIMVVSGFQKSAIDHMINIQYGLSQWEDLNISYTEPAAASSLESLQALPGVIQVEGIRSVAVRLQHQHYLERTSIQGLYPDMHLKRLLDVNLERVRIPPQGIMLSEYLAGLLHIQPGEMLTVEVLEDKRLTFQVPVSGITRQYIGVGAYMHLDALNDALRDGRVISGALLQIDPNKKAEIYAALKKMPRIAGINEHGASIKAFYANMAESILFFTAVATLLGIIIVVGVVYNNMSIALSEQKQELASLRILGFTRTETATLLLGEQALLSAIAIPLGFGIGYALCVYLAHLFATELYRIPVVVDPAVYARAGVAIILAWLASAFIIWQRIKHLDIIAALKSRE